MKLTTGLSAAILLSAMSALTAAAQAQTNVQSPRTGGMVDTTGLPPTRFHKSRPLIDVVDESPIVHYPTPVEPANNLWIDGMKAPLPNNTTGAGSPGLRQGYTTVNPMLGNRTLANPGFQSNIKPGATSPRSDLPQGKTTKGLDGKMFAPQRGIGDFDPPFLQEPASATAQKKSNPQVMRYNDGPTKVNSAGGAHTEVHATLKAPTVKDRLFLNAK